MQSSRSPKRQLYGRQLCVKITSAYYVPLRVIRGCHIANMQVDRGALHTCPSVRLVKEVFLNDAKKRWPSLVSGECIFTKLAINQISLTYSLGLVIAHKIAPTANPATDPVKARFPPILSLKSSPPTIQDSKKKKRAMEKQTTTPTDKANRFGPLGK
ncbi:MAG TPA: hypothetical protein VIM35_01625 [Gallionella sp.]